MIHVIRGPGALVIFRALHARVFTNFEHFGGLGTGIRLILDPCNLPARGPR